MGIGHDRALGDGHGELAFGVDDARGDVIVRMSELSEPLPELGGGDPAIGPQSPRDLSLMVEIGNLRTCGGECLPEAVDRSPGSLPCASTTSSGSATNPRIQAIVRKDERGICWTL